MMLVSEYATEVINTRPYKYQTRQTFFKDLTLVEVTAIVTYKHKVH